MFCTGDGAANAVHQKFRQFCGVILTVAIASLLQLQHIAGPLAGNPRTAVSLLEQQNLLTKLYTDPVFRGSFYADPVVVGRDQGLGDEEINELLLVAPSEVKLFSDSLTWKRFHEIEKLLPALRSAMGANFQPALFEFAAEFNPTSIRKHYEDALGFCSYIIKRESDLGSRISDAARFERAQLRFFNDGGHFEVCRNRFSFNDNSSGEPRPYFLGYAVWLRLGGRVLHFRV
jgi:hypothetical protein